MCVCTVVRRPDQLVAAEAHLRRQEIAELIRLQSDAPVVTVHHLLRTHTHTHVSRMSCCYTSGSKVTEEHTCKISMN